MILRPQLNRKRSWSVSVVLHVATVGVFPISSQVVADEGTSTVAAGAVEKLPRSGVLEVVITADGKPIAIKSISRALSKLEAILKAEARRPGSTSTLLVAISVKETTREFTDLTDAMRVVEGVTESLDAAKKAKIQLGDLGRLDSTTTQSQQSQPPSAEPTVRTQQVRSPIARDGDDGLGRSQPYRRSWQDGLGTA